MFLLGLLVAILIGVSLGLIGGGGSILTVPMLVYLFGIDAVYATVYSLFIVGVTSAVGGISSFRKGLVDINTVIYFGIPSIITVLLTRKFVVPAIPTEIFSIGSFTLTKNVLLLLLFAILMILAAYKMIRKTHPKLSAVEAPSTDPKFKYMGVLIQGAVVGLVTGLIGAGGGFLIIPALVNFLKLDMKKAVGTSLIIIALNSLVGFAFSYTQVPLDVTRLLLISCLAILGIFIGGFLSNKIDSKKLKPAFGWFVFIMGIYILLKETIL